MIEVLIILYFARGSDSHLGWNVIAEDRNSNLEQE